MITDYPIELDPNTYNKLPFTWAVLSDKGLCRQENEDTFLIEPEIGLFMISDGMGGHRGGALASDFVCQNLSVSIETGLQKLRSKSSRAVRNLLIRSIRIHNEEVLQEACSESGYKDMGATVVLCLIAGDRAFVANLGDSRLYRFRNNKLHQISRDHSVVRELVEQGKLHPEQADFHEDSNLITQYMGMETKALPDLRSFKLQRKDRILLCTDGLTDMIDLHSISGILESQSDLNHAANQMIRVANNAGGTDNITVILIEWKGAD